MDEKKQDMCGLVGIASQSPTDNRTWLATGRDVITHRGPDDAGEWWSDDGRVGLAHRRLSIIDLSPAGHQPMLDEQRGLAIVLNGEIYNFRELRAGLEKCGYSFRSSSDTEVLLAAYDFWGMDCLSRLNGMFAFALYDARRQTVFLARDRAGEKPLFYYLAQGTLRFASELKALMADPAMPRRIDPASLDCYLAMGYVPGERCMLQGYSKLPPAHALSFDLQRGTANVWRYWQVPDLTPEAAAGQLDELGLLDELEALLEDSVRRQLVADVPVGVLLSGGVDSSLITAMAVRASSQVKTFTIGFPGHGSLDETEHARLIARHFGTQHTELMAQPTTADLIPRLARQYDEPMVDSSMIPTYLVSQLVHQHCTVALGGDGGDELFGGYGQYSRLLWMQERFGRVPLPLRKAISFGAEKLPVGLKGRNWLQGLGVDLQRGLPLIANYFDAATRRHLMAQHSGWEPVAESIRRERIPPHPDLLQRATRMDFGNYLAEDILVKVDRASMLNSLEVRAPLLDYRLIEFAFARVPSHLKATAQDKKILLKRLTARVLPPEFDRERKQGFSIPLAAWLKTGPFRDMFHEVLQDTGSLFDRRTVRGLLKGQERGRSNGERLFSLVLFELWRREYSITI
jgi:asparagine synthase (glutamine-hydrolysing)